MNCTAKRQFCKLYSIILTLNEITWKKDPLERLLLPGVPELDQMSVAFEFYTKWRDTMHTRKEVLSSGSCSLLLWHKQLEMAHCHPDHHQGNTHFHKMRSVIVTEIWSNTTAAVGTAEVIRQAEMVRFAVQLSTLHKLICICSKSICTQVMRAWIPTLSSNP